MAGWFFVGFVFVFLVFWVCVRARARVWVFNRIYGQCFEFFLSFFNPSRKLVYKSSQGVTVEKYPPLKFFRFHIFCFDFFMYFQHCSVHFKFT